MSENHEHDSHSGGVRFYIIIALILGAITYVEFAMIEFTGTFVWMSAAAKVFWLTLLSVVKFALVVAIYMHLRDDDSLYTGFFSSGLVIAMGTFVALSFLFTVGSVVNERADNNEVQVLAADSGHGEETAHGEEAAHSAEAGGGHGSEALSDETLALIDSNGYSRPMMQILTSPPPSLTGSPSSYTGPVKAHYEAKPDDTHSQNDGGH